MVKVTPCKSNLTWRQHGGNTTRATLRQKVHCNWGCVQVAGNGATMRVFLWGNALLSQWIIALEGAGIPRKEWPGSLAFTCLTLKSRERSPAPEWTRPFIGEFVVGIYFLVRYRGALPFRHLEFLNWIRFTTGIQGSSFQERRQVIVLFLSHYDPRCPVLHPLYSFCRWQLGGLYRSALLESNLLVTNDWKLHFNAVANKYFISGFSLCFRKCRVDVLHITLQFEKPLASGNRSARQGLLQHPVS